MVKKIILLILLIPHLALADVELDTDANNAIDINRGGTNATSASQARSNLGVESATSNDIDPDRLAGDTVDDNTIDAAILPADDDTPDDDSEVPNNITITPINATTETAIENVVDLSDLQGAVTDAQVPNDITITETDPNALLTAVTDNVKDTHIDWGSGASQVDGADVPFADTDSNWTATTIGGALEELDNVINGGLPNDATGKVDWSQLTNVPAGFADGTDDGGSGTVGDEVFNALNFDGDTTVGVSQDDFYDRMHLFDADDDGDFTDETWFPSTSGAPTDASYITTTAEAGLSNETVLNDESSLESVLSDATNVFTNNDTIPETNIHADIARDSELHDAVTLGTTNGLSMSTQELSLSAATNSAAGAMTAAQVTALEAIDTEAELEALLEVEDLQGDLDPDRLAGDTTDDDKIDASLLPAMGGSTITATASGSISTGDTIVINSDGTVSAVAGITEDSGTAVAFESAETQYVSACYDSNAEKVVVAYRDQTNSGYGTAIVGTVSGTSISFGTPAVFISGAVGYLDCAYDANAQKIVVVGRGNGSDTYGTAVVGTVSGTSISFGTPVDFEATSSVDHVSCCYDANAQKIVVAFRDPGNSNYGTAIVGTVSGTSISFGTAVVFEESNTFNTSCVYDSNAQKVVITYRDYGNSSYGTSIVGTVSGTSISFGTAVVFNSATTAYPSSCYDSDSQKVVVSYQDGNNSNYGTAIVGTVSGTSISFGSEVAFEEATTYYTSCTYDSNAQKVVVFYNDGGNSEYGTVIVGTVSGTSISFGTAAVVESAQSNYLASCFDSDLNKVVLAYQDAGNSNYGTSVVFQNASTNLTEENYIGFSAGNYSDTGSATVNVVGNTDSNQSGLTAGQKYYVQENGSLALTADDTDVEAGIALSASKILIK